MESVLMSLSEDKKLIIVTECVNDKKAQQSTKGINDFLVLY